MKHFVLILTMLVSTSVFAKNADIQRRIDSAAAILADIAHGSETFTVAPSTDAKAMMRELAIKNDMVESAEDFEAQWTDKSNDAWGADEMLWALDTSAGAYSYISSALESDLEISERTDKDKMTYANGILALKKAFGILNSIKSVKYGVAPIGAVQCGVTFPALLIIDTENGKVHQITMESSGC